MRIRTIKPEFYQSEALGRVPREDRLLAAALITWADDKGYFVTLPAVIAGSLFPFDEDGKAFVSAGLKSLHAIGFIELFEGNVGHLPGFQRNQRINRPSESRLQPKALVPLKFSEPSVSPHGALSEPSPTEGKGREGNGMDLGGEANSTKADEPSAPSPQEQLRQVWNDHRGPKLSEWRRSKHRDVPSRERLKDRPLGEWPAVVRRIAASAFCTGTNDRGWKADPDWLLKPGTAVKVLEGKYDGNGAVDLSGDWRSRVDHTKNFFEGIE